MILLNVKGMHCNACEALIKDVLEDEGATNVIIDWKKGIVSFENLDREHAKELIEEEGYEVQT